MVDVNTAMKAARASSGKRKRGEGGSKKRPASDIGIEPFDPLDHVEKERGDTISMWLVISMGAGIALGMRYIAMPGMDAPRDFLWFLPLMLVVIIPNLHRVVIPEPFKSRYGFGNWFRASMLYIFTWLALCFLLINPPLGDIAAPEVAASFTVVMLDEGEVLIDAENLTSSRGVFTLDTNGSDGNATVVFGVRDNRDTDGADLQATWIRTDEFNAEPVSYSAVVANLSCEKVWDGLRTSQQDKLVKHKFDQCVAVDLGDLEAGEYDLTITLSEQGDPWINSRSVTWSLTVV